MRGTAKEIIAANGQYNGVEVNAADLSILAKFGVIKVVDKVVSASGKGKPSNIYEIPEPGIVRSE